MGTVITELSYQIINSDTIYTLAFKDAQYQRINVNKVVAFKDLEAFRKSIYDCLEAKDRREISLGSTPAVIGYTKQLGTDCIRFVAKDGFVVWTEKQIDKLFN